MSSTDSSARSSNISTALKFLRDVNSQGYSEAILRQYLINKRGLTSEEVDVVFNTNKSKEAETDGDTHEKLGYKSKEERVYKTGMSERPERTFSDRESVQDVGYLLPLKRTEGLKLINDFLDSEKQYCTILQCLQEEYYDSLASQADEGKLLITRQEIDEIFVRIPDLRKFHEGFYLDLKRGSNIGSLFVRMFKFFEGYAEYMNDCQKTVIKMRNHISNSQLSKYLIQLSRRSIRQNEDMVDLLLYPLLRILDYSEFLKKLYSRTDPTQTSEYELLGKASRRIGRVATYIEKYKYGIYNQNEMNKVQEFLKNQCDILSPNRAIVRRGVITKRNSGWVTRNKRHVFFLFNDIVLWTTKNGNLRHAFRLQNCEVLKSNAKSNAERKFKLVNRSHKQKTLSLECSNVSERNGWYNAFEQTISKAKEKTILAWSQSEPRSTGKYEEFPDAVSDEEKDFDDESRKEQSEKVEDPYNYRYAVTSSFRMQQFDEIDPMDDNLSQISDQDVDCSWEYKDCEGIMPTSVQLSPFENSIVRTKVSRRNGGNCHNHGRSGSHEMSSIIRRNNPIRRSSVEKQRHEMKIYNSKEHSTSNKVRRPSVDFEKPKNPQMTIHLNDF